MYLLITNDEKKEVYNDINDVDMAIKYKMTEFPEYTYSIEPISKGIIYTEECIKNLLKEKDNENTEIIDRIMEKANHDIDIIFTRIEMILYFVAFLLVKYLISKFCLK